MLIGGCGGVGGRVVISYPQSKLFVAFKYCVFSIYIGIAFIETIRNHPDSYLFRNQAIN